MGETAVQLVCAEVYEMLEDQNGGRNCHFCGRQFQMPKASELVIQCTGMFAC